MNSRSLDGERLSGKTISLALTSLLICVISTSTVASISCYFCYQPAPDISLTYATMSDTTKGTHCFHPAATQKTPSTAAQNRSACSHFFAPNNSITAYQDGNRMCREYYPFTSFNFQAEPRLTYIPSAPRVQLCQMYVGKDPYQPIYLTCWCGYDNCNDNTLPEMQRLWYKANSTLERNYTYGALYFTVDMNNPDPTEPYGYWTVNSSIFDGMYTGKIIFNPRRLTTTSASTTDGSSTTGTDKPQGASTGVVVGAVVGSTLLVAGVAAAAATWLVRRHNAGVRARRAAKAKRVVEQPKTAPKDIDVRL